MSIIQTSRRLRRTLLNNVRVDYRLVSGNLIEPDQADYSETELIKLDNKPPWCLRMLHRLALICFRLIQLGPQIQQ